MKLFFYTKEQQHKEKKGKNLLVKSSSYLFHIYFLIYTYITSNRVLSVFAHTCFTGGMRMKLITLYLPEPYIRALDELVNERRIYPNRAEAIRIAVRDLLNVEAWGRESNG